MSEPTDKECFEAQAAIERLITFTQKREPRDRGICIFTGCDFDHTVHISADVLGAILGDKYHMPKASR